MLLHVYFQPFLLHIKKLDHLPTQICYLTALEVKVQNRSLDCVVPQASVLTTELSPGQEI
jgi:hypothetical protein